MRLTRVTPAIFHLNFSSQVELSSTFLRFQEHYESPYFKGKLFNLEEYKSWYCKNSPNGQKTGEFTYYTDWGGFNIPSEILEPFYLGKFDPLSDKEKELLSHFQKERKQRFYLIGTYGTKNLQTLKHEIAHGLFYTEPKYKNDALNIINEISPELRYEINSFLGNSGGYHPSVFEDETHAYILTGKEYLKNKGIKMKEVNFAHKKLDSLFGNFFNI